MAVTVVPELPSSNALMATTQFVAAAQRYRDEGFDEKITQLKSALGTDPKVIEASYAMLDMLKKCTADAEKKEQAMAQVRSGEAPFESIDLQKERKAAEKTVDLVTNALRASGVGQIQVDIAMNEKGEVIAGYRADVNVTAVEANAGFESQTLFPNLLNEALLASEGIICRNGAFFLASSRTELMKDEKGKAIPATRDQIMSGLTFLQEKCNGVGMACAFNKYDFDKTKALIESQQAKVSQKEVLAAPISKPSGPTPESGVGIKPE